MNPEEIEEKILGALLNMLGAPENPQSRYNFLTDPPNLQTMTRLKPSQINFVTVCEMSKHDHPIEFEALGTWSKELMETMISDKGGGREDIIKYEQSKRAVPQSSVNILSQMRERAEKVKQKVTGESESG